MYFMNSGSFWRAWSFSMERRSAALRRLENWAGGTAPKGISFLAWRIEGLRPRKIKSYLKRLYRHRLGMAPGNVLGLLLDIDSREDEAGTAYIRLFLRTADRPMGGGIESFTDPDFRPYFYVVCDDAKQRARELEEWTFNDSGRAAKPLKAEPVEKANAAQAVKLYFRNTGELTAARGEVKKVPGVKETREYDIPFTKRYLIDKGLEPMGWVEAEAAADGTLQRIAAAKGKDSAEEKLRACAFDLETLSPGRFSDPKRDAIVQASYVDEAEQHVYTWKKTDRPYVTLCKDEKEMVQALVDKIKARDPDIVVTYNGDMFDFPYLKERCHRLGVKFDINADGSEPVIKRKGMAKGAVKVRGRQHIDAYQIVRLLARTGAISLVKFDLESVAKALYGEEKEKVKPEEINQAWATGKGLERVADYNLADAVYTLRIAKDYLPLTMAMARLTKQTAFDVSRSSTGVLVEYLLIDKSFRNDLLIPNKPHEDEVKARLERSFEGGYVKSPIAGLHENIAVLDFRSMYPTIIISHHISPDTLNCACCKGNDLHKAPTGDWFCDKRQGFFSSLLEDILKTRIGIQADMKKHPKESIDYKVRYARQWALKILLNSFYGVLGYSRFRWYSRECAIAVTAWGRHYVREVLNAAEKAGFAPLYADSDSAFLVVPAGRGEEEVKKFAADVNEKLPGVMELEFEGFYKRGIFVTKKEGGAAKKKYALIDFEGNLTIVGFEYVRRDWAGIAKETQKAVLEAILKEGNPEKAVKVVRAAIERLKKGEVPNKELVSYTQLRQTPGKYELTAPHVAAALKAIKRGKDIGVGSVLEFIITKSGKSISEKAELAEFVKEGNYDADYYINNQVIPAVIKIMRELGYSEQDLVHGGKQSSLGAFG